MVDSQSPLDIFFPLTFRLTSDPVAAAPTISLTSWSSPLSPPRLPQSPLTSSFAFTIATTSFFVVSCPHPGPSLFQSLQEQAQKQSCSCRIVGAPSSQALQSTLLEAKLRDPPQSDPHPPLLSLFTLPQPDLIICSLLSTQCFRPTHLGRYSFSPWAHLDPALCLVNPHSSSGPSSLLP